MPTKAKHFLLYFFILAITTTSITFAAIDNESWSQKRLQEMSIDEKIGQLFMVAAYVDPNYAEQEIGNPNIIQEMDNYIRQYHIGGLAFVGPSESLKQVALTNHYQSISNHPLLIAQDLEWGLGMRLRDGMSFPRNSTLGAIKDDNLIYEMVKEIGRQAKLIGVHMNLSPVLDVNIEPENISINVRSFGDSPQEVAKKGLAMIHGLQDAGIIASAKHFPGMGDIAIDPHLGLPQNNHSRERFNQVEFYPFFEAIAGGVLSIQTEHLIAPALEPDPLTPSSLSKNVIDGILRNQLRFTGLIISGALRMKALTEHFTDDEIILRAFLAGHDMLLMPTNLPQAYQTLKSALDCNKINIEQIDQRVLKILQLKEWAGLNRNKIIETPLREQLHDESAKELKKLLYQKAVTILRDKNNLIALVNSNKEGIAFVQLGNPQSKYFIELLEKKLDIDSFILAIDSNDTHEADQLIKTLKGYPLIILSIFPADPRRIEKIRLFKEINQERELKKFNVHGLTESTRYVIKELQKFHEKTIVCYFGNQYGLPFVHDFSTVIMAYEDDPDAQEAASSVLKR